ncbi:CBO0543 family protein [Bacillota bacterium Lsc_1132]
MATILYGLFYIGIALKWADWKNWKQYYPTILFFMVGDLLYQFLFFRYSMWEYVPIGIDANWAKHTHISLLIMFIKYPLTVLIFLGHLPGEKRNRFLYILGWTLLYMVDEAIDLMTGGIVHRHGWNIWWSSLFTFIMFTFLAIHYKNPLFAWLLSAAFAIFLWNQFDVPASILK